MKWVVHEEISQVKGQKVLVYYLKKDKIIYGQCLNKNLAQALVDKYNKDEQVKETHEHI